MSPRPTPPGPVYYTTQDVAGFLGVSVPTVASWVDSGRIRGHRTPGGHRRIGHNDLIAFAREHAYPLTREFLDSARTRRLVLIIDGDPEFSALVQEYLAGMGDIEVEIAGSAFEAGYAVARSKPDLLLIDLMMPDVDGFEVRRILKEDVETRHVPVIACTSIQDREVEGRIPQETFDGFLEKPLTLEVLLALIQQKLGSA